MTRGMVIERAALVRLMLAHDYREDQIADLLKISRATVAKIRQRMAEDDLKAKNRSG